MLDYKSPIFIDEFDNFCAVGYLIKSTGFESVSRMIASNNNLAYVKDMSFKELDEWAQKFGFSKDELAWIQPGYPPNCKVANIGKGFDNEVKKLFPFQDKLYAVGSFSTADSTLATHRVAYVENDGNNYVYRNLGNGVNGHVNTMIQKNGQLFIGGSFSIDTTGVNQGVAAWDGTQWNAIGCINGNVKELVEFENEIYAVGNFQICDSSGAISGSFAKWDGVNWGLIAGIEDSINTAIVYKDTIFFGGYFTINNERRNIAKWSLQNGVQAFVVDTIQEINDFEIAWDKLFAVGKQTEMNNKSHIFLVYDTAWKPVYQLLVDNSNVGVPYNLTNFNEPINISSLTLIDSLLYATGAFTIQAGIGNGNSSNFVIHRSFLESTYATFDYLAFSVNGYLNAISKFDNKIFVAGQFSSSYGNVNEVNNFGFVQEIPLGISKRNKMQVSIYPNPANGRLQIDKLEQKAELRMYNLLAQTVGKYPLQANSNTIDLQYYNSGNYFIEIVNNKGEVYKSALQILK